MHFWHEELCPRWEQDLTKVLGNKEADSEKSESSAQRTWLTICHGQSWQAAEVVVETQSHVDLTWNKAYSVANQWVDTTNYKLIIYTKEISQKLPETATGPQRRFDFPTEVQILSFNTNTYWRGIPWCWCNYRIDLDELARQMSSHITLINI